ncbi:MAG: HEPN domain-containing protein [Treponema sp.]|nr:HEPN domain-containing protein [Treponema sp.]
MIFKLFTQRNEPEKQFDVYEYEVLPEPFINQSFYIIYDFIQLYKYDSHIREEKIWNDIYDIFIRQIGVIGLDGYYINDSYEPRIENYYRTHNGNDLLNLIDLIFIYFDKYLRHNPPSGHYNISKILDSSINELNCRFKQYGLGYEFINGELIKKTNEIIHSEVIKPSLKLLHDEKFKGAEEEFKLAFENYQNGNNKDAILYAQKSFESALKTICKRKKFEYDEKNDAKKLLEILRLQGFYPKYLNRQLVQLSDLLLSGLPKLRNEEAGHVQGEEIRNVENNYVEYAIHLAATNIVFLVSLL